MDHIGDRLCRPPLFKVHDEVYERMFGKKWFALYSDLGTAKTYMLLRDFVSSWQAGMVDGVLIVAPVGVHAQWVNEEWPNTTKLNYVGGAWPDCEPPFEKTAAPRVFAIYPEAFRVKKSKRVWNLCKKFLKSGRIAVIVDESQCMKNSSASTTRRIKSFKRLAAYRRVSSGYPAPLGLIDYYPQYTWLNTKILDCETKEAFTSRYCVMGGFRGKKIVGYQNEDDFYKRVAPYTFTVELDKCMDMPERTWLVEKVPVTPQQQKIFKQIRSEFRAVLEKRNLVMNMPMALQRLTRMQQVACGFLPVLDEDGKPTGQLIKIPEKRTEALENLLDRIRGKIVVWAHHTYCIDRLTKHFGPIAVRYRGGDRREMAANKEAFIRDPKVRLIFANQASGGTGFNGLTVSRHTIYWSNTQNGQHRRQTERRTWRIGQSRACVYLDLDAQGSYDAQIRNAVLRGQSVAQDILRNIASWAKG